MSTAAPQASRSQTRIFGIRLGVDPKFLVLGLVALAALLFWYNSRSDDTPGAGSAATRAVEPAVNEPAAPAVKKRGAGDRRRGSGRDSRLTLQLKPVSGANGEIDPVLRLDLLSRLATLKPPSGMRNLFESGPAALAGGAMGVPIRTITPKPLPSTLPAPVPVVNTALPQVHIPYKYYGFAKPSRQGEANRGFFIEGDNILVAAEGQTLQQRYRVVQLTPTTARIEDTDLRQEQTLPLVPEALEQGGTAYGQGRFGQPGMPGQAINPGFPNQNGEENQP